MDPSGVLCSHEEPSRHGQCSLGLLYPLHLNGIFTLASADRHWHCAIRGPKLVPHRLLSYSRVLMERRSVYWATEIRVLGH